MVFRRAGGVAVRRVQGDGLRGGGRVAALLLRALPLVPTSAATGKIVVWSVSSLQRRLVELSRVFCFQRRSDKPTPVLVAERSQAV